MKKIKSLLLIGLFPGLLIAQSSEKQIKWIGKVNRIANPGAEANADGKPNMWESNYSTYSESNWVSEYGTTSHEWNHGDKKLGLPKNAGNNYFRLSVNRHKEGRRLNIYQNIALADLQSFLKIDTVMAAFRVEVGSNYNAPQNCSFAIIKLLFYNQAAVVLDSIYMKRTPNEFRDLDAETPEAIERGFNVMHEFKTFTASKMVPLTTATARIEAICEFPCNKHISENEEESEGENSNTFFFDNFSLGFYQK